MSKISKPTEVDWRTTLEKARSIIEQFGQMMPVTQAPVGTNESSLRLAQPRMVKGMPASSLYNNLGMALSNCLGGTNFDGRDGDAIEAFVNRLEYSLQALPEKTRSLSVGKGVAGRELVVYLIGSGEIMNAKLGTFAGQSTTSTGLQTRLPELIDTKSIGLSAQERPHYKGQYFDRLYPLSARVTREEVAKDFNTFLMTCRQKRASEVTPEEGIPGNTQKVLDFKKTWLSKRSKSSVVLDGLDLLV